MEDIVIIKYSKDRNYLFCVNRSVFYINGVLAFLTEKEKHNLELTDDIQLIDFALEDENVKTIVNEYCSYKAMMSLFVNISYNMTGQNIRDKKILDNFILEELAVLFEEDAKTYLIDKIKFIEL